MPAVPVSFSIKPKSEKDSAPLEKSALPLEESEEEEGEEGAAQSSSSTAAAAGGAAVTPAAVATSSTTATVAAGASETNGEGEDAPFGLLRVVMQNVFGTRRA